LNIKTKTAIKARPLKKQPAVILVELEVFGFSLSSLSESLG